MNFYYLLDCKSDGYSLSTIYLQNMETTSERPKSRRAPKTTNDLEQDREITLLAEALFREYLNKKGFQKTLSAFDTENV
jgi:hypothetical protein